MKKKLILTSLNNNNLSKENLLLGKWCINHENNYSQNEINHNIIPFHWDDRTKLKKDYDYLEILHAELLSSLKNSLNSIHELNHDLRYWQIILDPWLMDYISILFDRWETIESAIKNFSNLEVDFFQNDNEYFPIETMDELHGFFNQNEVNQFIYQDIIKNNFTNDIEIVELSRKLNFKLNFEYPGTNINSKRFASIVSRSQIYNLVDDFLRIFTKNNKFVFIDSYFKKYSLIEINYRLGQIPRLYNNDFRLNSEKELSISKNSQHYKREKFEIKFDCKTPFEIFLINYIKRHLPMHIIENYSPIINEVRKIKIFGDIIITANSHWSDYLKKIWIAEKINEGSKLITLAHGGSFPPTKEDFNFEEDISDKRATWLKAYHHKHIQLPPSKLVHLEKSVVKKNRKNKYQNCSMAMYAGRKWSFRANFYPQSYQGVDLVSSALKFCNNLDKDIRINLKVRFHHNFGLYESDGFINSFGTKNISREIDYDKFISNSKFIVCTYPETTFAEAMATNIPTIMFYDKELFERHPLFEGVINDLVDARIIFFDPVSASNHMNSVWNDLDKWWNSEKVIHARLEFKRNAMKIDKYWSLKWYRFLSAYNENNNMTTPTYLLSLLKNLRYIAGTAILRPFQGIRELSSDVKKDKEALTYKSDKYKVWCPGLPHSGTTMMEEIFDILPYLRLNSSSLRLFENSKIVHPHGISKEAFLSFPENKYSFLKTHSHYEPEFLDYAKSSNVTVIVCVRDLRDMMLSRYWHIISNNKHPSHQLVSKLPIKEGIIATILEKNENNFYSSKPIEDYYLWVKNWLIQARKNNIKVLWYEDYIEDPIKYLSSLINYIEFDSIDPLDIEEKLRLRRNSYQKTPLNKRLFKKGREKSTFRSGKIGDWKEYFDDEIMKIINDNISGDLEDVIRQS